MKKINLIKRLWTDSHEKQTPQRAIRYARMLLMLLTLGVGQMWAGEYSGGAVYFDNSTTNWSYSNVYLIIGKNDWSTTYQMEPITGTSYYHVSLPKSGWSDATYIAVAGKNGTQDDGNWSDVSNKFSGYSTKKSNTGGLSQGTYLFAPSTSSNGWDFSLTAVTSIFTSCPTDVLNESKIMVYAGEAWDWNQGFYRFMSSNSESNTVATAAIRGIKKNLNNAIQTGFGPALLAETSYYHGHWPSGLQNAISAGKAYMVYGKNNATNIGTALQTSGDNSLYDVTKVNASPTTSVSTTIGSASFPEGTSTLSVSTGSAGKSVMNNTNNIEYYLNNGSTWTKVTLSTGNLNVSSLTEGTYQLATVLYDGYIYVKADEDEFEVTAASKATLTYDGNDNTSGTAPAAADYAIDASATVADEGDLAKTYYTFAGWNTAQYITGTDYSASSSITMDGSKTLYAKWTRSVTLNQNSATSNGSTSVTATYNCATLPSITNPSKDGYTFGGWYTANDASGSQVINTSGALQSGVSGWTTSTRFTRTDAAATLYARWSQNVTLNANTGNHGSGSNTSATIILNATAVSSITHTSAASGYHLEGYYTAETGGTKILNDDGTFAGSNITDYISSGKWIKAGATTLYAQYEVNTPVRLYYSNPEGWETIYAYVWDNSNTSDKNHEWHGEDITSNTLVRNGDTYYYFEYYKEEHSGWNRIIFNNNDNEQTNNITFNNTTNDGQYNDAAKSTEGTWRNLPAEETTYSVTFYAGDHGAINARGTAIVKNGNASVNIGATARTLTATPESGYSFDKWVTTGSVTVADVYSESTTVTASAAGGTVTATYLANSGWYLHGNVDGATDWCANDYWPHRWPIDRPYRGVSGVYYRKISSINNGAYFGIHDGSNKYSGNNSESDYSWNGSFHDLVVNTGHCFQASTAFSDKWVVINTTGTKKIWVQSPTTYYTLSKSSDHGTVTLTENSYGGLETSQFASGERVNISVTAASGYWIDDITIGETSVATNVNASTYSGYTTMPSGTATLTVTYNRIYSLSHNANGGSGAAPATTYHISGTTATAAAANTFTARAYYTFGGWNTAQYITGINYDAGASVPMNANTILYAKWTRTITLNQEDATTEGTTSVTGTYNCATLPDITNPEKTGYSFGGWYTQIGGGGNLVINTSGVLQSGVYHWTDQTTPSNRFDRTTTKDGAPLYAKWTQTVTLNANIANHGSGDNTSATIVYKATAKSSITHCTPATGYHLVGYYTDDTDGTMILDENGAFAGDDVAEDEDDYIVAGKWVHAGATTLYAHYEANTYTVTLKPGVGGTGSDGSLTVDYDATAINDDMSHSITQTGYSISGWYNQTAVDGSLKVLKTNGDFATDNVTGYITSGKWSKADNCNLYAWWTPNQYAITFDATTNGGTISGSSPQNVTFDENEIASCPTATKNGYCFDGWYTKASNGKKVINADGTLVANVTDGSQYTGTGGAWKMTSATTVYAVYTIPTIEMTPNPTVLNSKKTEKDTVVIHQTFSCTPTGLYNVVYTVGYSANHTQLAPQPTIIYGTVAPGYDSIKMPMDANTYEIVAELRSGSTTRGSGTVIKRDTLNYVVEDQYSVTLNYIVDGIKIRDSREVYAYPSSTATQVKVFMEENGYELDYWEMGAGIDSVDGRRGTESGGVLGLLEYKYIYAHNNGHINLHYKSKDNTVYFFNTFEMYWYSTIMKKYDYGTSTSYWANTYGAGSKTGPSTGQITPDDITMTTLSLEEKRWMAPIGASTTNFAFVSEEKDQEHFWGAVAGNEYPHVIYRTDYNAATPMFVPVTKDVHSDYYILNQANSGEAHYYRGFWVKFSPNPDSTGYYLHVYNQKAQSGAKLIQTLPLRLTQTGEGGTWELTAKMDLEGGKTYGFKVTKATGASTKTWYSYNGTLTAADHEGKVLDGTTNNIGLTTTTAGDYTFHVFCKDFGTKNANTASASEVQGQLAVTVDYATVSGDYRVIYSDATHSEVIASSSIHPRENGQDTVSFFIRKSSASRVMKIQKYTSSWADFGDPVDLSSIAKDSVYVLFLKQNADADNIEVDSIAFYDGDFYIRTDCVDEHKWDYKQSLDNHRMNPSDYGMSESQPVQFTHYYVHWVDEGGNVKFVVANKYAPCVSDTLITDTYANVAGGNLPSDADAGTNKGASIRFMYNKGTNEVNRAYLAGAQGKAYDPDYLKMTTSGSKMGTTDETPEVITGKTFTDLKNFVYQAEIKAKPGLTAKLTAEYNGNTQYFRGSSTEEEEILGGTGDAWQNILLTYDFKTNRLICAWQPSGDSINGDVPINADVMVIRVGQEDAQQIIFKNNDSKLSSVKYIYSVMQFNYDDMVSNMFYWGPTAYEFCMYYVSFPYDVLVNDIMAPGRMGSEWRLQRYNGAKRAEGWFAGDGVTTFWEDVQSGDTLKAYEGYSLLLNRRIFNDGSSSVWANKGAHSKLYMYFPSKDATTGVVANKRVDVVVPSHECTVDRVFDQDKNKPSYQQRNHKIVDSHWNMIGTPLFEDRVASNITEGPTVEGAAEPMQYIYRWNPAGNTLGIQYALDEDWEFRTMYSYMAQYAGTITFVGSAVNKIVAANRETKKKKYTINLELTKDEQSIGRTYVELRENAVDTFLLNEDVYMVKNGVNADLYTFAGAYEAGANVLTVDNHIVPVGVDVKTPGTYVFSMPNNFDGEVVLVDSYAQTRTNLLLEDYEIALPTGTINDRFFLEIKINKVPTAIDGAGAGDGSLKDGKAHKFIMNDMMYILKDGVLYDARGNRVK